MEIKQLYTGCLAEAAYYIESNGEIAIIDPMRDVQDYLDLAKESNAKIKYVLETHFHADFVSGHVELAKQTGAHIVYGPNANPSFDFYSAKDGQELSLGDVSFKVLHTPGHTMESSCYLLRDEEGKDTAIFTGDTLFIGDVGRPDLAVKTDLTKEDLAGHLFDSLRNKIMPLADEVVVYPAHGQGSACGKNMSSERFDTLGNQKKFNYALRADMSKEEFVKEVTEGIGAAPQYFPKNVELNRSGYDSLDSVLEKGNLQLKVDEFEAMAKKDDTLVLDTRGAEDFSAGHIPNSLFIGIDGGFAPWVGTLVENLNTPILIVCDEGRGEEVITRLSRVGYQNPVGVLASGMLAWKQAGKTISTLQEVSAEELAINFENWQNSVVDVRKPGEYNSAHLQDVSNKPLDYIAENASSYASDKPYYLHCAGGYRSVIAASILKQQGIKNVINIKGGFAAIKETDLPILEVACSNS